MNKINVFVSYSHQDTSYKDDFIKYAKPIIANYEAALWHDKNILTGENIGDKIQQNLVKSSIVVCLISSDYLASDYCMINELQGALNNKQIDKVNIFPIILRKCSWKHTLFGSMLCQPNDGQPVTSWTDADDVYTEISDALAAVIKSLKDDQASKKKTITIEQISSNNVNKFENYLNDFGVKIKHPQKDFLLLDDIFVYPDLKQIDENRTTLTKYKNPTDILEKHDFAYFLGTTESGKTTLMKKLAKELISQNYYAIVVDASNIRDTDPNEIIKKFNKSYGLTNDDQRKYVLLVDDLPKLNIRPNYHEDFFSNVESFFEKVYFFIDKMDFYGTSHKHLKSKYDMFEILNFGYLKRNEIYKKWYSIGADLNVEVNDNELLKKIDTMASHFDILMKKNIMESKPIYILTIIQTLDNIASTKDFSLTSYGHCYSTLLQGMLAKAGVSLNHDFDGIITFLSYLAYYYHEKNIDAIDNDEFDEILKKYNDTFMTPMNLKESLKSSGVLYLNNVTDQISFSQKYIFYFCCAKYISDHHKDMVSTIDHLCVNIHNERNANILIFLVHHLRSPELLNDILVHTACLLDHVKPYDLTKDAIVNFKAFLKSEISNLVIQNKNYSTEREKLLEEQDMLHDELPDADPIQHAKHQENIKNADSPVALNLLQDSSSALRSIEVLGQISKNRYSSMKKSELKDILMVAYNLGLKALQVYMDIILLSEADLKELLKSMILEKNNCTPSEAALLAEGTLHQICYNLCAYMIQMISKSTAHVRLLEISESVVSDNNSPAIRLIDLYSRLTISKEIPKTLIKKIKTDNEDSPLVIMLLKQMVLNHSYLHKVHYTDMQWIQSTLGIRVEAQIRTIANKQLRQLK